MAPPFRCRSWHGGTGTGPGPGAATRGIVAGGGSAAPPHHRSAGMLQIQRRVTVLPPHRYQNMMGGREATPPKGVGSARVLRNNWEVAGAPPKDRSPARASGSVAPPGWGALRPAPGLRAMRSAQKAHACQSGV